MENVENATLLRRLHAEGWRNFREIGSIEPVGRPAEGLEEALRWVGGKPTLIIEIGVEMGGSTRLFASSFPAAQIVCVDPWIPEYPLSRAWQYLAEYTVEDQGSLINLFRSFMLPWRDRIYPVRSYSLEAMRVLAPLHPDIVYVDGDHRYLGVFADMALIRSLFPNAIVIGDDWNFTSRAPKYRGHEFPVREAVEDFAETFGGNINVFGNTYVLN